MSYEKHTWTSGETVTAAKLNNLEDGVASGGSGGGYDLVVELDYISIDDITNGEIVDGSYSDTSNKIKNCEPISIMCYGRQGDSIRTFSVTDVIGDYYSIDDMVYQIYFSIIGQGTDSITYNPTLVYAQCCIYENDGEPFASVLSRYVFNYDSEGASGGGNV